MHLEAYSAVCDPFGAQIACELLDKKTEGLQACLLVILDMKYISSSIGLASTPQAICHAVLHLVKRRKGTSYDGKGSADCLAVCRLSNRPSEMLIVAYSGLAELSCSLTASRICSMRSVMMD